MLQQCDTPQVLYDRPDNMFVAAFIGSPAMTCTRPPWARAGGSIRLGSPEHMPTAGHEPGPTLVGDVNLVEALGSELVVHLTIDAPRVQAEGAVDKDTEAVTEAGGARRGSTRGAEARDARAGRPGHPGRDAAASPPRLPAAANR